VFGTNCVVLAFTGRECDVSPYMDTYDSIKSVPIAKAGTAWTSPESGTAFILVFNEALWMGDKMDHTLVNPNQIRLFGITVQDNPVCESPLYIMTEDGDFVLPLQMKGTNVMANTRTPTSQELHDCTHIILLSKIPWDLHRVRFPESSCTVQEEIEMQRLIGGVRVSCVGVSWEEPTNEKLSEAEIFNMDGVLSRLISSVKISKVVQVQDVPAARTFESKERHTSVTPEDLSELWLIGLGQARETLKRTTQRIVRSAVMPLARRYWANQIFEKRQLRGQWFTDTLDGRVTNKDGNRYGQVFANRGYFATVYPMDTKRKTGNALRTFCQELSVPDRLTCDRSKEQTGEKTEFMPQVRKNDNDLHVIAPERHYQIRVKESFEKSDGNGSVPWYAVAFHGSFGTMACVGFAKLCKEPQHKLADLMAVLLLSQLQARLLIFQSIWILGSTIQSGTTRTQVSERDYRVVGLVPRIVSEV